MIELCQQRTHHFDFAIRDRHPVSRYHGNSAIRLIEEFKLPVHKLHTIRQLNGEWKLRDDDAAKSGRP